MRYQEPLPEKYGVLSAAQVAEQIAARKRELGARVCILGHHYQRDEVIQHADFTGDSLKLSRQAAATQAAYIVFCGVHFMAETADILSGGTRAVILPDLSAGCAMAEMADLDDAEEAMVRLERACGDERIVPVTYVNSSAALKAFTGQYGGACCTSSNAKAVFEWALRPQREGGAGGDKVLAIPDQHLGRNTAMAMGFSPDECVVYDHRADDGGLEDADIRRARFILWKGHCYVHQRFSVEQIARVRAAWPGVHVIVHPECPYEVVRAADQAGSTEQILSAVNAAPAGSCWAVGTETNMVRRLARNNPDKRIRTLADTPPLCMSMSKIDPPHLLWVLDNLANGRVVNRVSVDPTIASQARVAVERMVTVK